MMKSEDNIDILPEQWQTKRSSLWLLVAFWLSLLIMFSAREIALSCVYFMKISGAPDYLSVIAETLPHQLLALTVVLIACKYINPEIDIKTKLKLGGMRWFLPLEALGIALLLFPVNLFVAQFMQTFYKHFFDFVPQVRILEFLLSCSNSSFVIFFFTAVFIAPITEEIIFRRLMYGVFKNIVSPTSAVLLTSLIFAAIHQNLLQLGGLFVLALVLQGLYLYHRSLLPCMLLHFFNNLCSMTLILLVRSGIIPT